ncbi:MAG: chalcone isomerase family protein [Putridiphycobacter sp.]|nr:chalcone isomerase family protein [Putridiphycobacter sp.]
MKKFLVIIALCLGFSATAQTGGTKVNGIIMPNIVKVDGKYLKLNGAGVREKMFLDLYIGALYLEKKTSNADEIIKSDSYMSIKMRVISGMVTRENMEEAIREGFKKSTNSNTKSIDSKIDDLINKGFAGVIEKGDVFDLEYIPGKGTHLKKNGKILVVIPGLEFKQALFGIWLCNQPADANLKKKMLGT